MSMNTPLGQILTTKNIKDFEELEQLQAEQYVVAVADDNTGRGGKIKATKLSSSMISADADNQLIIGSDNKLYAKMSSITDVIDAQNMYETGRVLTDERGLNQLKDMKRSTFDRSKFTIVGSPTITDDGIASGLSGSNYITFTNPITTNNFNMKFRFYTNGESQEVYIGATGQDWSRFVGKYFDAFAFGETYLYGAITQAGWYIAEIDCDTTTSKCKLKVTRESDSNVTENEFALSVPNFVTTATNLSLGINLSHPEVLPFGGSIDLKQFSIEVDGKEVLNGNKTGIDQIKKDDFTVVGNPTISVDGIASGFSSESSYVRAVNITELVHESNNWEIYTKFTTGSLPNRTQTIIGDATEGGVWKPRLNIEGYNHTLQVMLSLQYGGWQITFEGKTVLTENTTYYSKIVFTGNYYQLFLSTDGINFDLENQVQNSAKINNTNYLSNIGVDTYWAGAGAMQDVFTGSIDLNSFKIYVDGNLVYQPCLKIPYTQSKTGSKIVDAIYRDRVQDMYEQFGQANYYTISDTDFTLPMGEIYGMFGNNFTNNFTNNPYSLLDCKWSDHEISNLSWLRSNGQWNNGNVYKSVYDLLVDIQAGTKTIAGISVKLSTEVYTDDDFVINTSNTTFRLAIKTKLASGKAVVGNGMTLGMTNGSENFGLYFSDGHTAYGKTQVYGLNVGDNVPSAVTFPTYNKVFGLTTDPTKSGIETDSTGLYLYYYVGETVTNHTIIDVADIASQLTKYDEWVYFQNGTSGYRYNTRNGYCEQWGKIDNNSTNTTVTFLKKFANANYNLTGGLLNGNATSSYEHMNFNTLTATSFIFTSYDNYGVLWKACGYLADDQY